MATGTPVILGRVALKRSVVAGARGVPMLRIEDIGRMTEYLPRSAADSGGILRAGTLRAGPRFVSRDSGQALPASDHAGKAKRVTTSCREQLYGHGGVTAGASGQSRHASIPHCASALHRTRHRLRAAPRKCLTFRPYRIMILIGRKKSLIVSLGGMPIARRHSQCNDRSYKLTKSKTQPPTMRKNNEIRWRAGALEGVRTECL